jgi:hypothetical protein
MSKHGFTAVPRDFSVVLKGQKYLHEPTPLMVSDIQIPDTPLAKRVLEYAKSELREETFNQYVSRHIPRQTETGEANRPPSAQYASTITDVSFNNNSSPIGIYQQKPTSSHAFSTISERLRRTCRKLRCHLSFTEAFWPTDYLLRMM